MESKIQTLITKTKTALAERLAQGKITQAQIDKLSEALNITDLTEYCKFQELKSIAAIDGTLTLDDANLIYKYLGNTPEQFNKQPVEVKSILTTIFATLLKKRVATLQH